jgi:hypothetical protein
MHDIPFESAESSSFPVLGIDEYEKLRGIGTCTLVRLINDNLFLLNSGHTLEIWGNHSPIFISLPNGKTIELPFALKTESSTVDKIDIAVTPLVGDFAMSFQDSSISSLPLYDDFPIDSFKDYSKQVVFFGYPASRCSINLKKKELIAKPIFLTLIEINKLSKNTINFYNIDFSLHIIARFQRRKMKDQNRKRRESPFPHGMSGGAVFYEYVKVGESEDIFMGMEFVGIGNEYLDNPSLLKATKKHVILEFIEKHFN